MSITLDQIIQQGGPVGFALLFAWLWINEKSNHKETRKSLDDLTAKILRKAGVIDNV